MYFNKLRVGQLVKATQTEISEVPSKEYKYIDTQVYIGRVKEVDFDNTSFVIDNGTTWGIGLDEEDTRLELIEDVSFADMKPGYYRYYHVKQGTTAVVHFDGVGFGHSDQSPHKAALVYFGFDPVSYDALFERIVQN
jgi:hypothetical protein